MERWTLPLFAFLSACSVADELPDSRIDRARLLIERLGDPDIETRGNSERELMPLAPIVLDELEAAARDDDSEVSIRARRIIDGMKSAPEWRAYRESSWCGLELQARLGKEREHPVEDADNADPRPVLQLLESIDIFVGGSPRPEDSADLVATFLNQLRSVTGLTIAGFESVRPGTSWAPHSGRASALAFLKGILRSSQLDMMLVTEDVVQIDARRVIYDGVCTSPPNWNPLQRQSERNPGWIILE
jgi:hypothetical protein